MPGMNTRILSNVERVLESVGVGLWTWDGARSRMELDATCRMFLDLADDEEWDDAAAAKRLPPEDLARYGQAIVDSLKTGTFSVEFRVRRADGSTSYLSGRGHVLPHLPEDMPIVKGVLIDVTSNRELERALERRGSELERSNRDLEHFAYVASHDLKAPLRAMEVLVEWLRDDLEEYDEGEVQENLGLLKQRTGRLNRLLDDLLAYSRATTKVGEVAEVDSRELVQDIVTLLGPPKGMTVEADASLPKLWSNRTPLEQVLRNLINNAIKHHPTPADGRVRVYAQDQGDSITFAVEDDGAGIPEQYAEKVFQMFQTLQPRDDREGSGMGLAIVSRIVEWQGGRTWFHAGPEDKGTVFKFVWKTQTPSTQDGREESHGNAGDADDARQHLAG